MNPGPVSQSSSDSIYPCGTCDRPVTWEDRGIVCDTCNQWYHVTCQSMCSGSYDKHVNDSAIAWDCLACNSPNYTTLCYSLVFSTSNHFSVLSDAPLDSPTWQPTPIHASTPVKVSRPRAGKKEQHLRILNVNFQSIKTKQHLLSNLIDSTRPDIIFGTETWIDNSIKDSQIFPPGFNIYRTDRNLSGGGVLIAVKDTYITTAVPELHTDCEIVWCKLELVGHKSIYLSTFYNPKTSNEEGYKQFGNSVERASRITNAYIIGAGDFNLPGWDWKNNTLKPNTAYSNIHHNFTDILDDHGLNQVVVEPTRGLNVLDLRNKNEKQCIIAE